MSTAESELLAQYAKTRNAEAFRSLVQKHGDMVFATSRRIVGNAADAEDVAQDCFILLSRHAAKLRAPVAGWLHQVAVNVSLKFVRDKQVRRGYESCAPIRSDAHEDSWDDVRPAVDEAIAALPERNRTVIVMHYLEGRRQEDIAAELELGQSTVSRRLNRGVALLRKHLRGAGFATPAALALLLTVKTAEASPPSLVSSLGKLALSGVAMKTKIAVADIGVIGGMSVMKIGAVTAVAASVIIAGGIAAQSLKAQAPAKPVAQNTKLETNPNSKIENPKSILPNFGADDAIVQQALKLNDLIEAEKKDGKTVIDRDVAVIFDCEEKSVKSAALIELTAKTLKAEDRYAKDSQTVKIGKQTVLFEDTRFYDLKGRKLTYTTQPTNDTGEGYYLIRLVDPLDEHAGAQVVRVCDLGNLYTNEGKVWHIHTGYGSDHSLQFMKLILPKSAIFVDSYPRPVAVATEEDRTAVTIRGYVAQQDPRPLDVAFLWPKKDGGTLTDLPGEYRGVRDPRDEELSREYERGMAKTLDGADFNNQSTPVKALLTRNCAILKNDWERFVECSHWLYTHPQVAAQANRDVFAKLKPLNIDDVTFLSTPAWPDKPQEGYIHPVRMCYPGTAIRCNTIAMIWSEGKWRYEADCPDDDILIYSPDFQLNDLPFNGGGPEVQNRYNEFVKRNPESAGVWQRMGLYLVGAGYWDEALDAFSRSEALSGDRNYVKAIALIGQACVLDVQWRRDEAIAKYKEALDWIPTGFLINLNYGQYNITINNKWVEERVKVPFLPQMIGKEAK